ncbi:MAG: dihydropteroate synthase-like protein [Candidatus Bathyarchaeota archaeon]|nr:dihydropteroate synthase-like protein [Candidatus Bathyarchaeota archaeon]
MNPLSKKKLLIITGTLAYEVVEEYVSKCNVQSQVISLPIQVAALMNTKFIAKSLKSKNLKNIDFIIIPGLAFGDSKIITAEIEIPVYKGPKYAADLPFVLNNLGEDELSTTIPACELMTKKLKRLILGELVKFKEQEKNKIKAGIGIPIGNNSNKFWIDREFGPRILAEIVNASLLTNSKILETAKYFVQSGADIIDIGMLSEDSDPNQVKRIIKIVRKAVNTPISIDTSDVDEIEVAVNEGIDLILSINAQNMEDISKFALNIPVVVTPVNKSGACSEKVSERVEQLTQNLDVAKKIGFKKIIADPILKSPFNPGLMDSIIGYYEFFEKVPKIPILFGLGNVTELIDCDSLGANLLLASLATELKASIVLVTEASDKTRGCVKEVSTAIDMAVLSKIRKSPPKDLGLDLLRLKEKRRIEELYDDKFELDIEKFEKFKHSLVNVHDPKGSFKIMIDRKNEKIVAIHLKSKDFKPDIILKAKDPFNLYQEVLKRDLISKAEHSFYLGIELSKAREALVTGKSYVQDNPLFKEP